MGNSCSCLSESEHDNIDSQPGELALLFLLVAAKAVIQDFPTAVEHALSCYNTNLPESTLYFFPSIISSIHTRQALDDFCKQHMEGWKGGSIELPFLPIWELPTVTFAVHEFEPKTGELLRQFQYVTNPETGQRERVEKTSPPLGMMRIGENERRKCVTYLDLVAEQHLEQFAKKYYGCRKADFSDRLLRLMVGFKPDDKESSLFHDIHRLLICTYIMCRTITIPPTQFELIPDHHAYVNNIALSPRMANRQFKFLFYALYRCVLTSVLEKLKQILRSSEGAQKWMAAFMALLGIAVSLESIQRLVHITTDAQAAMGKYTAEEAERVAEVACRAIDEKFTSVNNLFLLKYHTGFNPLRDVGSKNVREVLGDKGTKFVEGLVQLISENHDFLSNQQHVEVSAKNQEYTGTLVGRVLLSFWSIKSER